MTHPYDTKLYFFLVTLTSIVVCLTLTSFYYMATGEISISLPESKAKEQVAQKSFIVTPASAHQTLAKPESDPLKDWFIYEAEDASLSFFYPPDASVTTTKSDQDETITVNVAKESAEEEIASDLSEDMYLTMFIYPSPPTKDPLDTMAQTRLELLKTIPGAQPTSSLEPIKLTSLDGMSFTATTPENITYFYFLHPDTDKVIEVITVDDGSQEKQVATQTILLSLYFIPDFDQDNLTTPVQVTWGSSPSKQAKLAFQK